MKSDVTTNYEKNLSAARSLFRKYYQKPLTPEKYSEIFFQGKVGDKVSGFEFEERSAVVLLGMSCMGKTTFANQFIKKHPEFTLCSFDNFAIQLIASALFSNVDEKAIHNFGFALDTYLFEGRKLIIDGQFVNVVARSAIFNTLSNAGYTIYVISFLNMPNEEIEKRLESRAVENTISDLLCKMPDYNPVPGQKLYGLTLDDYANHIGVTRKRALAYIQSKQAYKDYLGKEYSMRVNELIDSNVLFQIQQDAFIYGCDFYYDLY